VEHPRQHTGFGPLEQDRFDRRAAVQAAIAAAASTRPAPAGTATGKRAATALGTPEVKRPAAGLERSAAALAPPERPAPPAERTAAFPRTERKTGAKRKAALDRKAPIERKAAHKREAAAA
jgi:hypothetical protein